MLSGRLTIIGLGALAMWGSMLLQKKQYPQVAIWKMTLLAVWLTITGVGGSIITSMIVLSFF